ncbi:MAG: hypothetical protein K9M57_07820 [Phycisphaerae bacterium]|nr:hypothetical protein [Phycisphaerae bacterium]
MTAEPNKPENNDIDIDELTSKWFDSGPDEYQIDEYSEIICEKMDSEKLRQTADLQLVNSMLIQLADKDQVAKERQIQNVLNNVKNSCTASSQFGNATHSKFYCYTRPLIRYAVAAVLIVSITFIVTQMSTNTAMAAIDKMMAAINNAVDRTYSIMVEGNRENRQQQSRRNSQGRREQGQRADLDGATLYLRGTNQFVLYRQTSRDRTLINGGDGQTRWMIRPDKTVFTSSDPEAFKIPMPKELAAILTLDFKATLQHIRDHYKVKFIEDIYDD